MVKQLRKKKIITAVLFLLLIAVYFMIFFFSSENAEDSSALSSKVTNLLFSLFNKIFGGNAGSADVPAAAAEAEGGIRKLAHFIEYMTVGVLSFGIAVMWIQGIGKSFFIVAAQLVISAGLDELHQYFVPGRSASVKDVMLDTAGGVTGIILILVIRETVKQWKHIRQLKSKTCS